MNEFVSMGENLIHSQEGSLKTRHLRDKFVEQFSNISRYRELRKFGDISRDMEVIWAIDPILSCKFVIYLRMITRSVHIYNGVHQGEYKNQVGAGLKHESLLRMFWIGRYYYDYFIKILPLFIYVGSWKDLFQLWRIDIIGNDIKFMKDIKNSSLYWEDLIQLIKIGLTTDDNGLLRKYLPMYICRKRRTTDLKRANSLIAKYIMNILFFDEQDKIKRNILYRRLKDGKAYNWQVKISQQLYDEIDFDSIAGRALMLITNGKFLLNHNLEGRFFKWIKSKPVAKFTGYVYELFKGYKKDFPEWKKYLINRQFDTLLEQGKGCDSNLLVAMDVSGSMSRIVPDTGISAYTIARALALYFSYFLKGYFANSFVIFNDKYELCRWVGETSVEKWEGEYDKGCWASTDFQKVIDLFIILKERGVNELDFPKGILCISDGEFMVHEVGQTEFEYAINRLREYFSDEFCNDFRIILWDIPNDYYGVVEKRMFEGNGNFIYMAGYDANNVRILFGEKQEAQPKSTEEVFKKAMSQEVLNIVESILKR